VASVAVFFIYLFFVLLLLFLKARIGVYLAVTMSEDQRVYSPQVFTFAKRPAKARETSKVFNVPSVKSDVVFQVDKKHTWRKIDVCPCFKEESFYPQVVSLFDCLNANFGERSNCEQQQRDVDIAIMADIKVKQQSKAV
jgi:hypothetical protein